MQLIRGASRPRSAAPCALTIGNFDGVHRGHRALLERVVDAGRARGLAPAVMTFEPHPREFFTPAAAPARLSNLRDKVEALAQAGIERVFVQRFDAGFARLAARDFVEQSLIAGCGARWLLVGEDFRFGARRAGDAALLAEYAAAGAFEFAQMPDVVERAERISSTAVRAALAAGDLQRAQQLLGRPYRVSGHVVRGRQLGRTLGFPTLNLRLSARPAAQGIFAVRVHGLRPMPIAGVASIGQRPTVDDSGRWTLEAHLFDFDAQVYGALVAVELIEKVRAEQKYDTLDELTAAIRNDAARARTLVGLAPAA